MHRHNAVTTAVTQRLAVSLGELGRCGTGGGDTRTVVNGGGPAVQPVTQIGPVDQYVQRHLPDVELLEFIGLQPRRRIGHHDDGHVYRESFCCTPASARALNISSATA